jgi:hypothetical protein
VNNEPYQLLNFTAAAHTLVSGAAPIPEPGTALLLGLSCLLLIFLKALKFRPSS